MNGDRIKGVSVCVLVMLMLAGCGMAKQPKVVDTTSIAITNKGAVTSWLVDEFDKDYYNISDLTSMAIAEAAEYNTEHQSGENIPITVEKVESLEDGSNKVVVTHKYDSTDVFMDYNNSVLFYGTVADAVNAGYDLEVTLKSVKDDTLFSKDQILQDAQRHLLITDERAKIYLPQKVTHVSDGVVYEADGSVNTLQTEGTAVILLK